MLTVFGSELLRFILYSCRVVVVILCHAVFDFLIHLKLLNFFLILVRRFQFYLPDSGIRYKVQYIDY